MLRPGHTFSQIQIICHGRGILFRPNKKYATASGRGGWPELPWHTFFASRPGPGPWPTFSFAPRAWAGAVAYFFFRSRLAGPPEILKESLRNLGWDGLGPGIRPRIAVAYFFFRSLEAGCRGILLFAAWRPAAVAYFFRSPGRLAAVAYFFQIQIICFGRGILFGVVK